MSKSPAIKGLTMSRGANRKSLGNATSKKTTVISGPKPRIITKKVKAHRSY